MSQPQLSNNVLKMRFMQRSKEAELRAKERQAREASLKESQWVFDIANSAVLIEEASNVDSTVCGRRSFLKFNRDIERLQKQKRKEAKAAERRQQKQQQQQQTSENVREMNKDISDIEMAKRFQSFGATKLQIVSESSSSDEDDDVDNSTEEDEIKAREMNIENEKQSQSEKTTVSSSKMKVNTEEKESVSNSHMKRKSECFEQSPFKKMKKTSSEKSLR